MDKLTFGKTGLPVSPIGFGAAPIGFLETERQRVGKMLNFLLDQGVNLIDTAASYRGSEEVIGQTVGHRRAEYVLVSKCGSAVEGIPHPEWSPELIRRTVDRALKRLQTDHLDVMLLHSCGMDVLKKGEAMGALVAAQAAGKVRFVGYSGDNEEAVYAAQLPAVSVIQTSVNICDQSNIYRLLPVTRPKNIAVIAKRSVANACWKDVDAQPGLYKSYAAAYTERFKRMMLSPPDLGFDLPPERAWPEIALRYTLSQSGVHCAIVGTTNIENLKGNITYTQKGPLTPPILVKIREAFVGAEQRAGEKWVGQT